MKQILQSFKTGLTELREIPKPNVSSGSVLIKTTHSLVSLGTERMLVEFGKASLIEKARQNPDRVAQVLHKFKSEGILPTLEAVFNKLEEPIPLGYCNVGKVVQIGNKVNGFSIGDRVASNGAHAEFVSVPQNLMVKIPENISNQNACFTVIGSIGLQSIRLLNPSIGEKIVVIGLGLIGLITCQLLKANGCNVIGVDLDDTKCKMARKWGIQTINAKKVNTVNRVNTYTNEIGADGVIITASTKSDDVMSQAAEMSRKRGRIILVGVVGLNINRNLFYEKELTFQVSCSYGPGRYDDSYEQKGIDYPLPYVRWTEKRNFETILDSISNRSLYLDDFITKKVLLENFNEIYKDMSSKDSIASIITYPENELTSKNQEIIKINEVSFSSKKNNFGIIGSGNFTNLVILPTLKKCGANIKTIASSGGIRSTQLAKKYNIPNSTTNYKNILEDPEIDSVIITTRHNSHARIVIDSLKAGKNTFVEKPLAINNEQLINIKNAIIKNPNTILTVGFNRRFSNHIKIIKEHLGDDIGPINIIANMNAGKVPPEHWVNDLDVGGGRIIGEACHLMDLCVYISGSLIKSVCMNSLGVSTNLATENASILLKFVNGSNAVINYFSNGSKQYMKERLEVFSEQQVWITKNFKITEAYGVNRFKNFKSKIDKGHINLFTDLIQKTKNNGKPLICISEIFNVSSASLAAIESLKKNSWVDVI